MRKFLCLLLLSCIGIVVGFGASPPAVGDKPPDFKLDTLGGGPVALSALTAKSAVVLVVLRGYPGYQCPNCNRQAQDFLKNSGAFESLGIPVVMIYPGPEGDLKQRAEEFSEGKSFPRNFYLALDPGYKFTNLYGLRWDAPNETAYPATFIIEPSGNVSFVKISRSHGGRVKADDVLAHLRRGSPGG